MFIESGKRTKECNVSNYSSVGLWAEKNLESDVGTRVRALLSPTDARSPQYGRKNLCYFQFQVTIFSRWLVTKSELLTVPTRLQLSARSLRVPNLYNASSIRTKQVPEQAIILIVGGKCNCLLHEMPWTRGINPGLSWKLLLCQQVLEGASTNITPSLQIVILVY